MLELDKNYVHRYRDVKSVYCITSRCGRPAYKRYYSVPYKGHSHEKSNVLLGFVDYDLCHRFVRNGNNIEKLDIGTFKDISFKLKMPSAIILKMDKQTHIIELYYSHVVP